MSEPAPAVEAFGRALVEEAKRQMAGDSQWRIAKCLSMLREEEIWRRPNEHLVSVGNAVLHVCGNIRQWIVHGLGGAPDVRRRAEEFSETGPIPAADLLARLRRTLDDACAALDALDPATLLEVRRVQGFDRTGVRIIVTAVEHLSYHTGQISYFTKLVRDVDLGYYAGQDLNVTG